MEYNTADLYDKLSIELLKKKHGVLSNETFISEAESHLQQYDRLNLELFISLYEKNKDIWNLESAIRQAKDEELGLEEIGRRAIAIREHNAMRIEIKNKISNFYDVNPFIEHKIDHISAKS